MGERMKNASFGIKCLDTTGHILEGSALFPFAYEEVMGRKVATGEMPPMIHVWRHRGAFIMGLRDRQLPAAPKAITWLEEQGYPAIVRHSGGAAVPLDHGVVNVSLLLPKAMDEMDYRHDFEVMVAFLRQCLRHYTSDIEAGEIVGSYCPGDYDLSIGGRKFCGISQRRQLRSVIIQAFVNVEGSGATRAKVAREFYRIAGKGAPASQVLQIEPTSMASLSELVAVQHADDFVAAVKRTAGEWQSQIMTETAYDPEQLAEVESMMDTLRQRYDR